MKRLNKKTIRIIGILFFSALVFISNIKESNAANVTYCSKINGCWKR